jgi:uncharacterized repeat protein (TIGR03803 family)
MTSRSVMLVASALLVMLPNGAHAQYSVLYNFGSKIGDPCQPSSSGIMAQGQDGNLYSAAACGGANGSGAVFKITLPSGALTVLYNFDQLHGSAPQGGLTLGRDGYFYGTTQAYGTACCGTVFKIKGTSLAVLHNFSDGTDGAYPFAPPIQGTDGNFYGTTCGSACVGRGPSLGSIYKITSTGVFTPLYQFPLDYTHGAFPYGPLVQASDGNFYGTASQGGTSNGGVVFRFVTATRKLTVLYNFDGTHGYGPVGPLVQASDGNFYGTATGGGTSRAGVLFKITPTGSLTVLHNMNGTSDGEAPWAGLLLATDGNFYGAAAAGGDLTCNNGVGCGTLFKITPPPTSTFSVLRNLEVTTGISPMVTQFQRTDGILYGDTSSGGTGNVIVCGVTTDLCGVFYKYNAKLLPFVSLLPYSGKVGNTIEFLGQGFKQSLTTVSFGATKSTNVMVPTQYPGTYLTATVPSGATTGYVTVTTSGVTLKSNKIFRVIPQITSFSPTSGPVGTVVTINGESFQASPTGATTVTFGGGVKGTITSVSYMKITAKVPSGAKTGNITVTTPGGTATSSGTFTVN